MARQRPRAAVRKAATRAAQIASLTGETDAGKVALLYYEAALRVKRTREERRMVGGPPLWLLAGIECIGLEAAVAIAQAQGMEKEELPHLASYLAQGVYDVVARAVAEFDAEHYEMFKNGESHDSNDAGTPEHAGAREGERGPARPGGPER